MDNKDEELCDMGNALWALVIEDFNAERYNRYLNHIKLCAECRRRLEIDEVIPEDELVPDDEITSKEKLQSLVYVERACVTSYAEGIRDALVLTAVVIILFVVGVLVFVI